MLKESFRKYAPFKQINIPDRQWPNNVITKAPIWCSVDLRDGNQALVDPMNLEQKLEFFKALCDMGFKEIEIGFPSASETEYEICRKLIDDNLIPDDVAIQVLVQAREHLIRKTFEAVKGAKNVIVHFYNSTSTLQRKVVFHKDMDGITEIAVNGAKLIKELTENFAGDTNIRFEYSPESFSGTEPDNAISICSAVMEALGSTPENPVILNLPNTVEMCTPNTYADQIEYFIRNLPNRESAIISIHPHNDSNLPKYREIFERCTKMHINERQPYVGDLVFTAFSGSHQDAINKGFAYMKEHDSDMWEIPYLPIDPADVGRQYEPIIRINSQSGKGGAAFIMQNNFGYNLPKKMHPEFGALVQKVCDDEGRELTPKEVFKVFEDNYIDIHKRYSLLGHTVLENHGNDIMYFRGKLRISDGSASEQIIEGNGNGPIDAFCNAIKEIGVTGYEVIDYTEHAISSGSDSKAVAYIGLKTPEGKTIYGVGIHTNIFKASIKAVLCAINRDIIQKKA